MIDLPQKHLTLLRQILVAHVSDCEVRAFGSRVTGNAKPYSDLDLAVYCPGGLDADRLRHLRESFEESELPFRVDVLDWDRISSSFRSVIAAQYDVIQRPANTKTQA